MGRDGEPTAVRRGIATLAVALLFIGCAGSGLLTGETGACAWAGPTPLVQGLLLPDAEFGTVIRVEKVVPEFPVSFPEVGGTVPVMWPSGYTGLRIGDEVEVRTREGNVVATTGETVSLGAPGPVNVMGGLSYPADHGAFPTCGVI